MFRNNVLKDEGHAADQRRPCVTSARQAANPGAARSRAVGRGWAARRGKGWRGSRRGASPARRKPRRRRCTSCSATRAGLIRELFFEGFRRLQRHLETFVESDDPARRRRSGSIELYRELHPREPGALGSDVRAIRSPTSKPSRIRTARGPAAVRQASSSRVCAAVSTPACCDGDETDIALVLIALAQGLAVAENANRLGASRESIDRRWALASMVLDGLSGRSGRARS